jgi:DNA primase
VIVLGRIGYRAASPALVDSLSVPFWQVAKEAVVALGTLRAVEAAPFLIPLPAGANADLRRVSATALGELGAHAAIPALRVLLEDADVEVKKSAALAQMGVLEIHTWNARAESPYQHDRVVFDLDPGPAVAWPRVAAGAQLLRRVLAGLSLRSWVKTTGGKGLHVVVPIAPTDAAACLTFARTVAAALVQHQPDSFTMSNPRSGRANQILIDVLRNNRTNTSVCAYSLRARAGAPVSMPIAWDEVTSRLDPARFTMINVSRRLRRVPDPWAEYWSARQSIDQGSRADHR